MPLYARLRECSALWVVAIRTGREGLKTLFRRGLRNSGTEVIQMGRRIDLAAQQELRPPWLGLALHRCGVVVPIWSLFLDRQIRFFPPSEPAIHADDIGVAHLLQIVGCEC